MKKKNTKSKAQPRTAGLLKRLVRKWGTVEVRLNGDSTIDEIVAGDVTNFHLEQMDDGLWWMGITTTGGQRLTVNLFTRRNAVIACNAESEDGKICEGFCPTNKLSRPCE